MFLRYVLFQPCLYGVEASEIKKNGVIDTCYEFSRLTELQISISTTLYK